MIPNKSTSGFYSSFQPFFESPQLPILPGGSCHWQIH